MAERKKKTTTKNQAAPKSDEGKQYEAMFLFPPPGTTDVEGMIKIATGIIERHGGTVTARNDHGAVFEIVLPAGQSDPSANSN